MTIRRLINFAILAALFAGIGMISDAASANLDRAQAAIAHISRGVHG
jgi:hypothetical protein